MTLRHLKIFQAVAETGSFTKAADKLYITQSAVSHAIRDLEEQAGTPLFERRSKNVHLTKSGILLSEEAAPILTACRNLESRIGRLEEQAPIRIVSSITIAAFRLPQILREFYAEYPEPAVQVEVVPAAVAIETLRGGAADLALIEGGRPAGPFREIKFGSYSLYAVCAPTYRAAGKTLAIEEFCAERLLLREKGSAIRDTLDSALYMTGHTARPVWCSVNSLALTEAAKAGLGIAVLPELLVRSALAEKSLARVSVPALTLQSDMAALWHPAQYLTAGLRALLSLIEKEKENMSGA